ncbi:MAG: DUF4062 domain-containing protein [Planctomycetota bacterium]
MEKRYQVFVSSTYADLKDERQKVTQTLMEMDCIPAGMELFPAFDEEQFEFIKRVIDDCDYYVLIIGGRYGSLTADGVSYTEKEYQYAVSRGLKILAFVHESPGDIPRNKSEIDPELVAKLDDFRDRVKTGRLVKQWRTADQLPGLVSLSLSKTMKTYPAVGWVRGGKATNSELLEDLNRLRKENEALRIEIRSLDNGQDTSAEPLNLAAIDSAVELRISWSDGRYKEFQSVSVTWADIFAEIAPGLSSHPSDSSVRSKLAARLFRIAKGRQTHWSISLDDKQFEIVRVQLSALGLVDVSYSKATDGNMGLFWSITGLGQELMLKLCTVKADRSI